MVKLVLALSRRWYSGQWRTRASRSSCAVTGLPTVSNRFSRSLLKHPSRFASRFHQTTRLHQQFPRHDRLPSCTETGNKSESGGHIHKRWRINNFSIHRNSHTYSSQPLFPEGYSNSLPKARFKVFGPFYGPPRVLLSRRDICSMDAKGSHGLGVYEAVSRAWSLSGLYQYNRAESCNRLAGWERHASRAVCPPPRCVDMDRGRANEERKVTLCQTRTLHRPSANTFPTPQTRRRSRKSSKMKSSSRTAIVSCEVSSPMYVQSIPGTANDRPVCLEFL